MVNNLTDTLSSLSFNLSETTITNTNNNTKIKLLVILSSLALIYYIQVYNNRKINV